MKRVQRELPIKVVFSGMRPQKFVQHIKRVRIEGPEEAIPEEFRLDADEIASGGEISVDDVAWPDDCDVVDRRGNEPIVSVEQRHKEKRGKRFTDDGEYDDQ